MNRGSFRTPWITVAGVKRAVSAAALLSFVVYSIACSSGPAENVNTNQAQVAPTPSATIDPSIDYSKFTHSNESHAALPCLLCHKYDGASPAKVSFPGTQNHAPCAGCHVPHFENPQSSQMCSICHTDTQTGAMKQFPPLTSFNAKFDHAKHASQANCSTCHKPTQQGIGFSVPTRQNAHATCLQCHSTDSNIAKTMAEKGTNIDSCSTCHEQGNPGPVQASANYVGSFSHARHKGMSCNSCHTLRAGTGENQVSAPAMVFHKAAGKTQSCATCHNDKRAFGAAEFNNCARCHQGNSFSF